MAKTLPPYLIICEICGICGSNFGLPIPKISYYQPP